MLDFLMRRISPLKLRNGVTVYLMAPTVADVLAAEGMDTDARIAHLVRASVVDKDGNSLAEYIDPEQMDGLIGTEIFGHLMGLKSSPLSEPPDSTPENGE